MAAALALLCLMGFGAAYGVTLKATATGSALLRCDSALRGSPPSFLPPRLRWTRGGVAGAPPLLLLAVGRRGGALGLGEGGALVLPSLRLSQSGPYLCRVGGAESRALVNVVGGEKLFMAASIGANVTLRCPVATPPTEAPPTNGTQATPPRRTTPPRQAPPPARWFHRGRPLRRGAGPEGAGLKLGPIRSDHMGRYDCAIGERSGTVHVVLGEAQSLWAAPGSALEVPCRPSPPHPPKRKTGQPLPPPSQVTWFRGGVWGGTSGPPILKGWAAPGGGLGPMGALLLWGLRPAQSGRYRCEWAGLRGHASNRSHAPDRSHALDRSHAHSESHAPDLSPAPTGWDFPPLPPLKMDPKVWGGGDPDMADPEGGGGEEEEEEGEEKNPGGGGADGGGAEEVQLEVSDPDGLFPAQWGRAVPVGTFGALYVLVGAAVAAGLWRRHRAQQIRARQQRLWDRRFLRASDPGTHNSYGNTLCPTAHPSPPPELGSPIAQSLRTPWGSDPQQGGEEEEEEEEDEGYEHPDSNSDGYENEPGAPASRSSVGSYENDPDSSPASATPNPAEPAALSPGAAKLITGLQRALLAAQRWEGRSDGSAGSQPYEEMGGARRAAAPRRDGTEDDAGSYENMAGAELTP